MPDASGTSSMKHALTHPAVWVYVAFSLVTMVILQTAMILQSTPVAAIAFAVYAVTHCARDRIVLMHDSGAHLAGLGLALSTVINILVALIVGEVAERILLGRGDDFMDAALITAIAAILGVLYALFSALVGAFNVWGLMTFRKRFGSGSPWKPLLLTAVVSTAIGIMAFVTYNLIWHAGHDLYLVGVWLVMLAIRLGGDFVVPRTV